jgi:hypothetical protein
MDWLHEIVVQAVWAHLGSWPGACALWHGRFRSPLRMILVVRNIARATREPLGDVFHTVARPYLRDVPLDGVDRILLCEHAALRLLHDAVASVRAAGGDAVVTGGYAAWQLEHTLQCLQGSDAFPHAVRGTAFSVGIRRNHVWVPSDIDLVFRGDADRILPRLHEHYGRFCATLLDAHDLSIFHEFRAPPRGGHEGDSETLSHVMERMWFPPQIRQRAAASVSAAPRERGRPLAVRTWRLHVVSEPLYPTALHILQVHDDETLDQALDSFDFEHCRVQAVSDGGGWTFHASDETMHCLQERELRFRTAPSTSAQAIHTAVRIKKYYEHGFAFGEPRYRV